MSAEAALAGVEAARIAAEDSAAHLRRTAVEAVSAGATKIAVARAAGITRPTLDAWLAASTTS